MQTILGPFHPYLESAIVDEILTRKKANALCPLLILVPSDALRGHLKQLLSGHHQRSLINLHVLTFYQLSARLFAEACGKLPEIRDDLFLEEVVRQLVRTRQPGTETFAGIEDRAGGCAALWQTLRDLRDGLVDPQNALEASREGSLARKDGARTEQLLRLLHGLLRFCDSHDVHHHSDVDQFAARHAPSSPFLKQFERIFYYGFYDLTQIQLDAFRTIASHYPTTLLFPLLPIRPSHSGWTFAQRFYERHVQGYSTEPARDLFDLPRPSLPPTLRLFDEQADRVYGSLPVKWHCTVSNSFGIHDEVAAAAKEILRLVDDEGMGFGEIAVITRSLDPYGDAIAEIFREHQVPIRGSVGTPLVQFPLTQAVILLFSLPAKDFLRSHVIDLLSSPYFKLEKSTGADPPRPDLWDLASRELAICKGVHEWRRLRNYAHRDLIISQRSGNDESRVLRVAAAQMRSLADRVESLAADLHALPEKCSWSGYTAFYKDLLRKYLGITIDESSGEKNSDPVLKHQILGLLDQMAGLDCVSARVTLVDFSQTFEHWLERSSLDLSIGDVEGVTILSATAARGLSFRALFILGLNEGVFPRTIREDAFLRDRDREALERHLGYKINPKLAGFDEEKLVFILLVGAARERLYISFQRADENGRALLPSWYLGELKHALGAQAERHLTELTIPRSLKEKAGFPPFHREDWLLPEELGIRLTLENRDPGPLIVRFGAAPQVYKRGRLFVAELEGSDKLRPFDGAVGRLASYWRRFVRRGISPTALEIYARCPYQFYARQVLGLERLEQPEKISGPSPADYGELGHAILSGVYRTLLDGGYFAGCAINPESAVENVAHQVFGEYEKTNPVGYALSWQCLKEQLTGLIRQVVALDLQAMAAAGFVPASFETDVTDRLPESWPEPLRGLIVRGRMDRIDSNAANKHLRVIDYKFKLGSGAAAQDKNLARAALTGERLQPPFYSLLGSSWARRRGDSPTLVQAEFYYIAPRWPDGPLATAAFDAQSFQGNLGAEIAQTVAYLADGVREGRFFIQRGTHCQHCGVSEICRKNHPPSLWRAENDPVTSRHRALKTKIRKSYERQH